MQVRVTADAAVTLEEPADFRRFRILAAIPCDRMPALAAALRDVAELDGDAAAWVSEAWIRAASGLADSPEWQQGMQKMIGYAQKHGWWRAEPPAIRAHVEWQPADA